MHKLNKQPQMVDVSELYFSSGGMDFAQEYGPDCKAFIDNYRGAWRAYTWWEEESDPAFNRDLPHLSYHLVPLARFLKQAQRSSGMPWRLVRRPGYRLMNTECIRLFAKSEFEVNIEFGIFPIQSALDFADDDVEFSREFQGDPFGFFLTRSKDLSSDSLFKHKRTLSPKDFVFGIREFDLVGWVLLSSEETMNEILHFDQSK